MSFPFLTDNRESPGVTFAEPGSTRSVGQVAVDALASIGRTVSDPYVNPQPYADIFHAAERSMRLTGNIASEGQARAEAYDQRIKTVKAATGVDLENPERGGYAIDASRSIAQEVRAGGIASIDAKGGIPEYQRRIFDQKLAELQKDHPELQFGDADAQARSLARGATEDAAKATSADVNPVASLAFQFAGALVGSRRDPLFIGSLFAGPTTAVGRTALARVASSSLFTGLYNAGVSAAEQPTVQDWRARIGVEHGVLPAMQDVGLAFLTGAIPGAGIQAIKESVRAPLQRVLAGHPEPGDIAAVHDVVPLAARDRAALHAGEESVAADKATLTIPVPKDVPEPLHNDMLAAALKRADDPAEPSPAAVQAVKGMETRAEPAPEAFAPPDPLDLAAHGELTSERAAAIETRLKSEQRATEDRILGADADRWRKLNRQSNSAWNSANDAKAREYDRQLSEIEGRLSPAEQSALDGVGLPEHSDPDMWRDLSRKLGDIESSREDAMFWAASAVRDLPDHSDWGRMTSAQHESILLLRAAMERESAARRDPMQFLKEAFQERFNRYGGGADATELVQGQMQRLSELFRGREAPPPIPPALKQLAPPKHLPAEVEQRITEAAPKTEAEAHAVADEALDDIGRRYGLSALRDHMAAADAERAPPAIPSGEPAAAPRARGDVLDKVPWVDEAGRPKLLGAKGAAAVGERETTLSMLVRSCK